MSTEQIEAVQFFKKMLGERKLTPQIRKSANHLEYVAVIDGRAVAHAKTRPGLIRTLRKQNIDPKKVTIARYSVKLIL